MFIILFGLKLNTNLSKFKTFPFQKMRSSLTESTVTDNNFLPINYVSMRGTTFKKDDYHVEVSTKN